MLRLTYAAFAPHGANVPYGGRLPPRSHNGLIPGMNLHERAPGRTSSRFPAPGIDPVAAVSSPWFLGVVILLALVVFAPTLVDWFSGDDFWFLRASQTDSPGQYSLRALDFRNTGTSIEFDRYRPLYPIAWRIQFAAFGMHAFYYHAMVILAHVGCIVVTWLIARRLFDQTWAANLTALIFALHPAYSNAVAWIGANRPFATLPFLLSLLLGMGILEGRSPPSWSRLAASWVLYVVALLLHPSTIVLPAVLVAYVVLVAAQSSAERYDWRRSALILPYIAVAVAASAIQWWVRHHLGVDEAFRFGTHQWTNYGGFLGLSLVPVNASDIDAAAVRYMQLAASLLLLLVFVWLIRRRARPDVASFAIVWFLIALLPDSTLILGPAARLLYLPAPALAIVVVSTLVAVGQDWPLVVPRSTARLAVLGCVPLVLLTLVVTYERTLGTRHDASRDHAFAQALDREGPAVAPGGTLYIQNAPRDLVLFGGTRLIALVQIYYGDVEVQPVDVGEQPALAPGDAIFRYRR